MSISVEFRLAHKRQFQADLVMHDDWLPENGIWSFPAMLQA